MAPSEVGVLIEVVALSAMIWLPAGLIGLSYSIFASKPLTVFKGVEGFVIGAGVGLGITFYSMVGKTEKHKVYTIKD